MKKLLLVFTFATLTTFHSYGLIGLGVEGGYAGDWGTGDLADYNNGNLGLSFGFGHSSAPQSFLGIRFNFQDHGWGLGLHYDIPFVHIGLTNWLYFFVAGGIGANFAIHKKNNTSPSYHEKLTDWNLGLVGRLPVGLRFILLSFLEIFIEFDPNLGLGFHYRRYRIEGPGLNKKDNITSFGLIGGIGGSMGVRFWF